MSNYVDNTPWWDIGHQIQRAGFQGSRLLTAIGGAITHGPDYTSGTDWAGNPVANYPMVGGKPYGSGGIPWTADQARAAMGQANANSRASEHATYSPTGPGAVKEDAPTPSALQTAIAPVAPASPTTDPATPMSQAQHNTVLRDSIIQDLRSAKNPYSPSVLQGMVQSAYGGAADQYNGGERAIMDNAASRGVSGGISADEANYRAQMGKAEGDAILGARERFAAGASGWDQNNRGLINQASQSDIGGAQLNDIAARAQQAGQFQQDLTMRQNAASAANTAGMVNGGIQTAANGANIVNGASALLGALKPYADAAGQAIGTAAGAITNSGAAPTTPGNYSSTPYAPGAQSPGPYAPASPGVNYDIPAGQPSVSLPGSPGASSYHTLSTQSPSPLYNTLYPQPTTPTNAGSAPTGNGAGAPQGGGIPRLQSKFPNYRMGG